MRCVLVALLLVSVARADETADEKQRVLLLYQQATKEYNLGRYDTALPLYTRAYEIRADPAFLFNIAQCFRMLHRPADAAREYRAYLREAREAPNRPEVEKRIKDMEEEAARAEAAKPPTGTQAPTGQRADLVAGAPTESGRPRTWLWVTLGVGGATVVAAVIVGLLVGLPHHNQPPMTTLGDVGGF